MLSETKCPEPRFQVGSWYRPIPFFGTDFENIEPGNEIIINNSDLGYPLKSLKDLPAGKYYFQALINIYTRFERSDGHVIWVPMDQWEGQEFNNKPGNLYSRVDSIYIDPSKGFEITINLDKKNPPVKVPPDTEFIKRFKIKSELLSKFWGQQIDLGAAILLPPGYHDSDEMYPVIYKQGHFGEGNSGFFSGKGDFYKKWTSDSLPKAIMVHFFHPTPYYDDSYAVNSENNGPYGDAILQELIPYIEENYRIIREPWARILFGCSTGGWISLALQVFHPDFFGGTWTMAPDPVDFSAYQMINIYEDKNAYYPPNSTLKNERPLARSNQGQVRITVRQFSQMEMVKGTKGRSGDQLDAFGAVFGPVGEDGYPKPLFNKQSGEIDTTVANYFKEHFDLRYYMEKNWHWLGPKLVGKLHFICGDMDNFYLNQALYKLEDFLENTTEPYYNGSFVWGRPNKGHCWSPWGSDFEEFFKLIDTYIDVNKP
jgi:S-formylglutathione hydrolase FrmB